MRLRSLSTLVLVSCLAFGCGGDDVPQDDDELATSQSDSMAALYAGADSVSLAPTVTDTRQVVAVLEDYFAALNRGDYVGAYEYWVNGGGGSGRGLEEFTRQFAQTTSVHAQIGELGRIEGAAGSRYVRVPVTVHTGTTTGEHRQLEGAVTLRRSLVPGATEAQRSWRIYSTDLDFLAEGAVGEPD